jgi:hypothetical protein
MKYTNAGFPPIKLCTNSIEGNATRESVRQTKGEVKNFSIRTILNKPKQSLINLEEESDELLDV